MSKSHVSMGQKICVVTGQKYSSEEILLDTRLKDSLERNTVTGWGISPEAQEQIDQGFVAIVGVDEEKSEVRKDGNISPEGAYRTGEVAYVKREALQNIVNKDLSDDHTVIFVSKRFIDILKKLSSGSGEEE